MDESQRAFESELVIGMDHCLTCSIKEQPREKVEDHPCCGKSDGTCSHDHGVLITNHAAKSTIARQ